MLEYPASYPEPIFKVIRYCIALSNSIIFEGMLTEIGAMKFKIEMLYEEKITRTDKVSDSSEMSKNRSFITWNTLIVALNVDRGFLEKRYKRLIYRFMIWKKQRCCIGLLGGQKKVHELDYCSICVTIRYGHGKRQWQKMSFMIWVKLIRAQFKLVYESNCVEF